MTLNNFIQTKKKRPVSLKGALRRMRSLWLKGEQPRFDAKLSRVLGCSIERAEQIRAYWITCDFLGFDSRGLLTWRTGGL